MGDVTQMHIGGANMQIKFVKKVYKNLLSFLIKHLPIKLKANNVYTKEDILKPIIRACVENTTTESSCRRLNNISSDAIFYHLNKLSYTEVKLCIDNAIEHSFLKTKKKYRITVATIAIDITDIPYYGKDSIWVHNTKEGKALKIISVHIVVNGYRFTITVIPFSVFGIKHNLVKKLIETAKQHFKISCVLLDRGFESIDVINTLNDLGVNYIIPKKRNAKTVKILKQCYLTNINRIKHRIRCGNKYADFDLVVYETKDDIVGFITNMNGEPNNIANLYKTRWGIETGYRMKNIFYARTCSKQFSVRFLLILMSFMLYNFWILANKELECVGEHITAGDMCVLFVDFIENAVP